MELYISKLIQENKKNKESEAAGPSTTRRNRKDSSSTSVEYTIPRDNTEAPPDQRNMADKTGFSPQQQQWLQNMMAEALRASRATPEQGEGQQSPAPQTEPTHPSARIKPLKIGYFYPDMPYT